MAHPKTRRVEDMCHWDIQGSRAMAHVEATADVRVIALVHHEC